MEKYSLGLHLSTEAIGWSAIALNQDDKPCRVIDAGILVTTNTLTKQHHALYKVRKRKKLRMEKVRELFIAYHLLSAQQQQAIYANHAMMFQDPYQLKCKGLKEALTAEQLFVCLLHYAKYRGYQDQAAVQKESNHALQQELAIHHMTLSEYIKLQHTNEQKIRVTFKNITRDMILQEVTLLLNQQIKTAVITDDFRKAYIKILTHQNYYKSYKKQQDKAICKLGSKQECAPQRAPSYELLHLLQKLQDLRYERMSNHVIYALSQIQIKQLVTKALTSYEITYQDVEDLIKEPIRFIHVRLNKSDYHKLEGLLNTDQNRDIDMLRHQLKLQKKIYKLTYLQYLKTAMAAYNVKTLSIKHLDQIATILTKYKTNKEIVKHRSDYPVLTDSHCLYAILKLDHKLFNSYGKFSFEIIYQILPKMFETNISSAMKACGIYPHKKAHITCTQNIIPPLTELYNQLYKKLPEERSLMMLKGLRKVCNAVIKQYGIPEKVHAGYTDLTENLAHVHSSNEAFNEYEERQLRHTLYVEQAGIDPCVLALTGNEQLAYMNLEELYSEKYIITSIIPDSLCSDFTIENKILIHRDMYDSKRNETMARAFQDYQGYKQFTNWVQHVITNKKKRYNLMHTYTEDTQQHVKFAIKAWSEIMLYYFPDIQFHYYMGYQFDKFMHQWSTDVVNKIKITHKTAVTPNHALAAIIMSFYDKQAVCTSTSNYPYQDFITEVYFRLYGYDQMCLKKGLQKVHCYTPAQITSTETLTACASFQKRVKERPYGRAVNPKQTNMFVLTNRVAIATDHFQMIHLNRLYDKDGTQKDVYKLLYEWLSGFSNGAEAYRHLGYPILRNGHYVKRVKIRSVNIANVMGESSDQQVQIYKKINNSCDTQDSNYSMLCLRKTLNLY